MAQELPYLPSYKNVEMLFTKIASAKQPDAFTTRYLSNTLGLKSAADRSLISLLKALGFLDAGGRPTTLYGGLKNPTRARISIGQAVRKAYEPLFSANENAHTLAPQDLNGLISQVTGADSSMTTKIAGTFRSLTKIADFTDALPEDESADGEKDQDEEEKENKKERTGSRLSTEFHYNIQIHLPTNATEETYLNIFNALRKAFK